MSILIRGMEMPQYGCDNCFLRTGNYCGRIEKDESVIEYARKNERHPNCPLVPVPPHGDLIDRDAFIKRMNELVRQAKTDGFDLGAAWYTAFIRHIELAPTIIPASEEGET